MSYAIVSGYFDPLHKGHLDLFRRAKKYGDLIVIVNNNEQAINKKGKYFMDELERAEIIRCLESVKNVEISIDKDGSVCRTLEFIKIMLPESELYFVNGDEYKTCAEEKTCKKLGIKTIYGEGKKIQSSSNLTGLKKKK